MIKEVYKRNWDFIVFDVEGTLVISVVFTGMVDYFRTFKLEEQEIPTDFENLKELSEKIRNNYAEYKNREIIPAITKAQ